MRIAFWVNDAHEVKTSQTTSMLILAAKGRGHEVWVVGIEDLGVDGRGRVVARAGKPLGAREDGRLEVGAPEALDLLTCDAVLIRTNPGRGGRADMHSAALGLAELLEARNVRVLNHPAGLRKAASKLFLAGLPAHLRPRTAIGSRIDFLREFVEEADGPCVVKPLVGTRGQGVFKVSAHDPNLQAVLATLTESGPAMVQDYLPEAAAGDMRLIVLEGEPLAVGGRYAAVRRVPAKNDWRSNIHLGGHAIPAEPTPEQLAAGREMAQHLLGEGIVLAGLDLIGNRAVEINVFSTGGFRDANAHAELDYCQPVLDAFERRIQSPRIP
ncbi:MAG: hypothetical protein R3F62_02575 [Planctomycetota bacterium]